MYTRQRANNGWLDQKGRHRCEMWNFTTHVSFSFDLTFCLPSANYSRIIRCHPVFPEYIYIHTFTINNHPHTLRRSQVHNRRFLPDYLYLYRAMTNDLLFISQSMIRLISCDLSQPVYIYLKVISCDLSQLVYIYLRVISCDLFQPAYIYLRVISCDLFQPAYIYLRVISCDLSQPVHIYLRVIFCDLSQLVYIYLRLIDIWEISLFNWIRLAVALQFRQLLDIMWPPVTAWLTSKASFCVAAIAWPWDVEWRSTAAQCQHMAL